MWLEKCMVVVGMMLLATTGFAQTDLHTVGDHDFPKSLKQGGTTLSLKAATHYRYLGMFDVLSAGIYLPSGASAGDFTKPGSKALRLCYDRKFSAKEFSEVTVNFMKDNNPLELVEDVRKEIDAFNKLYQAVVPGDCYAIFYAKGKVWFIKMNACLELQDRINLQRLSLRFGLDPSLLAVECVTIY